MPYIRVYNKLIEVDRKPKRIPKTITVGGVRMPVDRDMFMLLWAIDHATKKGRAKLLRR